LGVGDEVDSSSADCGAVGVAVHRSANYFGERLLGLTYRLGDGGVWSCVRELLIGFVQLGDAAR
jgi:hypothetical protein